jgi:DNA-binding transcriptional regulator YdaS (Cro superfamily)
MCRILGMNPIERAIESAGGATKLALSLGVTTQAVCFWRDGKRSFPAERCPDVEALTGVSCEELRPDVNWAVLRNKPRKQKAAAA